MVNASHIGTTIGRNIASRLGYAFPGQVSAGLALWLDALDDSTMFTTSTGTTRSTDGNAVGRWEDKSGNGNNAIQASAGAIPVLRSSGINSKPAVDFDTDDFLLAAHSASLVTSGFSAFCVFQRDVDTGNNQGIFGKGDLSASSIEFNAFVNTSDAFVGFFSESGTFSGVYPFTSTTATVGTAFIVDINSDGADCEVNVNDGLDTGTNSITSLHQDTDEFVIGRNTVDGISLNGRIAELIFYRHQLEAAERTAVLSYLGAKWGITLS